jgi:hypothetical protein
LAKKPPPPDDEPTAAELNPAIAYVQASSRGVDVVVAAADLGSQVLLTASVQNTKVGRQFGSPAWSADGQFVAFWSQDHMDDGMVTQMKLYVAKADASQVTLVRDFTTRPGPGPHFFTAGLNWSPCGRELIYATGIGSDVIVAIDTVTGDTRYLLNVQEASGFGHPALSPDLDDLPGYQGFLAVRAYDGSTEPDGTACSDIFIAPLEVDINGYLMQVNPALFVNLYLTRTIAIRSRTSGS